MDLEAFRDLSRKRSEPSAELDRLAHAVIGAAIRSS